MNGRFVFYLLLVVAALAVLLSSFDGLALVQASEPAQTAEPAGSGAEATAPPGGEGETGSGALDELLVGRTPAPTATADPITERVRQFTTTTGIAGETFLGLTSDDWINLGISLAMVLVAYFVFGWVLESLLRQLTSRTPTDFDERFLDTIGLQLRWLIVILTLRFATARLLFVSPELKAFLNDLYFIAGAVVALVILWKLVNFGFAWLTEQQPEEDIERLAPLLTLLRRLALACLGLVGITIILANFGVNVTALTASLGLAGLALSLAAQDTLSDAISGFIILLDQPFRVGDRIEISELGTWGDVVEIGYRTTRVRTRDNRMVIVPNSTIGSNQVVNYTFPDPQYRVQLDIGIGYGMDIEKTRQIIIDAVRQVEGVLPDKPVEALYNEMGDSAMVFRVRWWIESYVDTRRIFDRVNTALEAALDAAEVDRPFPTHTTELQLGAATAERLSLALGGTGGQASN